MTGRYDPAQIAAFFDACGEREWQRFESPAGRISVAVHVDLLAEFVAAGDLVLDAGAGPGRFTVELARLGPRRPPPPLTGSCVRIMAITTFLAHDL